MHVIDLHCDALWKLADAKGKLDFRQAKELDTNLENIKKGKIKIQAFAIFVKPEVEAELQYKAALEQIHYFYDEVVGKNPDIRHLKKWSDFYSLQDGEIGAFLTLEGVEPVGRDLARLKFMYHLGVLSVGLTWNYANLAGDGTGEPRGEGLTSLGKEIIRMNNEHQVFTDVSHLSEKGFWDLIEIADYPIASHSNAKAVYNHPRNLTDEQAKALFQKDGMIHVVYNPPFINGKDSASIDDLIRHIDHFSSLGGVKNIGLGSDFDGITHKVRDLENASKTQHFILKLLKYYKEEEVRGFAYENFLNHLPK